MNRKIILLPLLYLAIQISTAQVLLDANGPGNTYEDINAVLAPGYNAIEVPDCNHTSFGRHIDEVFDADLNSNVFRFFIHTNPDNDRCINFDRQRNEIKTYNQSPNNLKAVVGETVKYKWKFKISSGFQPSSSFTHIHQIKSVDGSFASIPMITLTLRKASPNRVELRYTPTNDQNTIETADLSLFEGNWVEVNEIITYGDTGSYSIEIKKITNNQILLSYSNDNLDMWQDGASFARPKWGIYRSLNNSNDLRDEEIRFANFSIEEINPLFINELENNAEQIILTPNPSTDLVTFKNAKAEDYDVVHLFDNTGKEISTKNRIKNNQMDVSELSTGLYFIVFKKAKQTVKILKCMVN
ncbi:T9SS type A sorting domain-containing protein [Winogradskyella litoriviva]|uniref:T9SS type A sorting domain-containing protein n=1 Tax=Winogradskyella litoriviva TaxID=1220182 RepID=A0ABX2E7U7_9FLAO|nr:T9SS type A sorting domain-containing protein [Winogradskyella litoriviva]NRD24407.1 T9SS type A sorting domain-containing protein [Winogradskyella litoriviva]